MLGLDNNEYPIQVKKHGRIRTCTNIPLQGCRNVSLWYSLVCPEWSVGAAVEEYPWCGSSIHKHGLVIKLLDMLSS